jgi:hypothetical protein
METESRRRFRRLDAVPYAAAYADNRGDILAVNNAFHELWCACGVKGPIEGRTLLTIFTADDRQDVKDILDAPIALPRPLSCVARLVELSAAAVAEFVPIHRKSVPDEVLWLVTLHPPGSINPFRSGSTCES